MILKKNLSQVSNKVFFSDKGKSKFIYTVRADINFLTQVKMIPFFN